MLTQEKKNNQSIIKSSFKRYPKTAGKMLPWLFNFFFVIIASLALGFLTPYSFFFTVPLALIPFFYALQLSNSYFHVKDDLDNSRFKAYLKSYFSPLGFGCYRIIRSALFSLLISLICVFAFSVAYLEIAMATGTDMNSVLNSLVEAYQKNDVDTLQSIMKSEPLLTYSTWVSVVDTGTFIISFLLHIFRYGILSYFRFSLPGADARSVNALYKATLRSIRTKGYNKDYFLCMWPILLVVLVGFSLGIYIGFVITNIPTVSYFFANNPYFASYQLITLCGTFMMFLFITIALPYYFDAIYALYEKYELAFGEAAFDFATKTVNQLKQAEQLSKEEREEIEKSLDEIKKKREELENSKKDVIDNNDDKKE